MPEPILVHSPHAGARASRLILLNHGVGHVPESMVPLGEVLARSCPDATILSVPGGVDSDLGGGRQWFSVIGITEENRHPRVAAALPKFVETVQGLQSRHGVGPEQTVLVGFSQGAIISLEAARYGHRLSDRIVSLAGRFAALPERALPQTIHLIHGTADERVETEWSRAAAARLQELGSPFTLDLLEGTGHEVTPEMARVAAKYL